MSSQVTGSDGMLGESEDDTAALRAENQLLRARLRDAESRLASFALIEDAFRVSRWRLDPATGRLTVGPGFAALHRWTPDDGRLTLERFLEDVAEDDRGRLAAAVEGLASGAEDRLSEVYGLVRPELPEPARVRILALSWVDPVSGARTVHGTERDVSAEVRSKEALEALTARYEMVIDATRDGVFDWDLETGVIYNSPRCRELCNFDATVVGNVVERLVPDIHPEDRELFLEAMGAHAESGEPLNVEYRMRSPGGGFKWLRCRGVSVRDEAGRALRMVGAITDVTAEKHMGRLMDAAAALARVGSWQFDVASEALDWNDEMFRIYRLDPRAGTPRLEDVIAMHPPEDQRIGRSRLDRTIADGAPFQLESKVTRADGSTGTVLVQGRAERVEDRTITVYGSVQDITALRELEHQLQRSQRLESVGRLAAGVAHEFSNLLTAVSTYAHLIADDLPPDSSLQGDAGAILSATQRAEALVEQLIVFSRQQVVEPRIVAVPGAVDDVARLLRSVLGEDVELEIRHAGSTPSSIRIDPGQLDQVLVNLAVRARDAMPGGGVLRVETGFDALDSPTSWAGGNLPAGAYVTVDVTDTGAGLSPEALERLFEPFSAPDGDARGTGLGLATVYGIVAQAEGGVLVRSDPDHGTSFRLQFPHVIARPEGHDQPMSEPRQPTPSTVLVVEDDPLVRDLTVRVLERRGYRVIAASAAGPARAAMAQHGAEVTLLVTDVVMPGASGRQLADELAADWPDLRVLYVSGYTEDTVLQHGVERSGVPFLIKPFTPSQLAAKVQEVLEAPPG